MAGRSALHTPGGVTDASDARLAQAGSWAKSGITPRVGIVYAGNQNLLTATASMVVNVAPLHFVGCKSDNLGVYVGANDGTYGLTIAAPPGSGSRTDKVYIMQQDAASTVSPDASTAPLIAATSGAFPPGAVQVGYVVVPAGITKLTDAGVQVVTNCQWTAAAGAPIPVRNQAERDALTLYEGLIVDRFDNDYLERYTGTEWVVQAQGVWATFNPTVTAPSNPTGLTTSGRYQLVGKSVTLAFEVNYPSGFTPGSGTLSVSLPFAPAASGIYKGTGSASATGADEYPIQVTSSAFFGSALSIAGPTAAGNAKMATVGGGGFVGTAWGVGGFIRGQITYQRA